VPREDKPRGRGNTTASNQKLIKSHCLCLPHSFSGEMAAEEKGTGCASVLKASNNNWGLFLSVIMTLLLL